MASDSDDSDSPPSPRRPLLSDQIVSLCVKSKFPVDASQQVFLPDGELDNLITREVVAEELMVDINEGKDLISFVCGPAKKVFATTVLANFTGNELRRSMSRFRRYGFSDTSLPVEPEEFNRFLDADNILRRWSMITRSRYTESQWRFLAPVFPDPESGKELKLVFQQEHIFPFTHVDEQVREGTFGKVYQVSIHASHQESVMKKANGMPANAAIKELKASSGNDPKDNEAYKEWINEARALDELKNLSHPNMIQVRAIITRERKHYFMFQWADRGCLRDFYLGNRRPTLDSKFVKEVVVQLRGLADALHALHNYKEGDESYRHGDLKPENILMFEDGTRVGIWKVADMGLAKHHFAPTMARGDQTTTRYGTPSYESPEVVRLANRQAGPRSRLYDIWSMGCITLELILWLLHGYDWLLTFNNSLSTGIVNPYWMLEGYGDEQVHKVHSNVTACMDHIEMEDPECTGSKSTAIRDLLQLVRTKLLVVAVPRDSRTFLSPVEVAPTPNTPTFGPTIKLAEEGYQSMREPAPGPYRANARTFCYELDKILEKGKDDDEYWFAGTPRDDVPAPLILPAPGSGFLAAPRIQIPLVNRPRDKPLQEEPAGLRAPSPRPD